MVLGPHLHIWFDNRYPRPFVLTFRSPYPVTLYIDVSFVGKGRPS